MKKTHSDITGTTWIERLMPPSFMPYVQLARLDRPIGIWLLLFPSWWSISLGAAQQGKAPDIMLLGLFAAGAIVMRAAGCVINDMMDRNLDKKVARTASRPLASGRLSMRQASLFLAVLLAVGLVVLIQLNFTTILLGVLSLVPVSLYPLFKRFTYWPQAWLGITFNWGALMGWTATGLPLDLPPLLIYLAGFYWTMGYDTIYAHQDKADDRKAGIKSSALKLGKHTKIALALFYMVMIFALAAAGRLVGLDGIFLLCLLPAAWHLVWQIRTLDIEDPQNCLVRFRANRFTGLLVLLAIWGGHMLEKLFL